MNSRLDEAYTLYLKQDYYNSHEILEDYWKNLNGQEKIWTQGLIQFIVTLHLIQKDRIVGARKVYQRAMLNLKSAPTKIGNFDLSQIQKDLVKELF